MPASKSEAAVVSGRTVPFGLKEFFAGRYTCIGILKSKGLTMRAVLLCLVCATFLSGCGEVRPSGKDTYRADVHYTLFGYPAATQTAKFSSNGKDISALMLSYRDGSTPVDKNSSDSFHTNVLYPNPKVYDQIKGTELFHDIRLVVSYHLNKSSTGPHSLHFWGSMDYMSSLDLRNCVGPNCVGGTVAKHLDIQGDVPLLQDAPATYDLPNGLKMTVVLQPEARFESR
jgi:hypothetical protein